MTLLSTLTLNVWHIYKPKNPPNNQPFTCRCCLCFNGPSTNTGKMSLNLFLPFPFLHMHCIPSSFLKYPFVLGSYNIFFSVGSSSPTNRNGQCINNLVPPLFSSCYPCLASSYMPTSLISQ